MTILVGVDAGGSQTTVVVADDPSTPLARTAGPPAAVSPGDEEKAVRVIARIVADAIRAADCGATADALVVGAAGTGDQRTSESMHRAMEARSLAGRIRVTTDIEIALASAFPNDCGILVGAGTGSYACARTSAGEQIRVGGLGWRMGDEGSGYNLGVAALRWIGRSHEGRAQQTVLTEAIMRHARAVELNDLVHWANQSDRNRISTLAKLVCDQADQGDATARELVDQCAADLLGLVEALLPALSPRDRIPVAFTGGLLSEGSAVRRRLEELLRQTVTRIELLERKVDATLGAVRLAARLLSES